MANLVHGPIESAQFQPRLKFRGILTGLVILAIGALSGIWASRVLLAPPATILADQGYILATARAGEVGQSWRLNATAEWPIDAVFSGNINGVITGINAEPGSYTRTGDVLFTVNQRPVVLAEGSVPAFRTMSLGDSGSDVSQLQKMLFEAGYFTGDITGTFGNLTQQAVLAWQRDIGISASETPGPTTNEINRADLAVRNAETNWWLAETEFLNFLHSTHPDPAAVECSLSSDVLGCVRLESAARNAAAELGFAQAERAKLNMQPQRGAVELGDIIFVPKLPARIALNQELSVGISFSGMIDTIYVLSDEPQFSVSLTEGQLAMLSIGTEVELQSPSDIWRAKVSRIVLPDFGPARAILYGLNGQPVCGTECSIIPVGDPQVFPALLEVIPETSGIVVPAAAIFTNAQGLTGVTTADGSFVPVTLLASASGQAAVTGIDDGTLVRTPGTP